MKQLLNTNTLFRACLYLLFICCSSSLVAQTAVKKLEKKKTKLNNELNLTSQLLKEITSEKKNSVNELKILEEQLDTREELVKTLNEQLVLVEKKIEVLQEEVKVKEKSLDAEKEEYAEMIRYAYKSRSNNNMLIFLMSADSFNDAYRRLRYIKEYNDYRVTQVNLIAAQKDTLDSKIQTLHEERGQKTQIVDEAAQEKNKLLAEKKLKSAIVNELESKESELAVEVEEKQIAINSLESEITSIIEAEIKKEKAKAEAARKAKEKKEREAAKKAKKPAPKAPPKITKTPESVKLSNSFASNKGKLPWPVSQGVITGKFGKSQHKVRGISVNNTGIDISTKKNADVRAVFDGEVTTIIYSPVFQNAIIVKHGDYFSVYSNVKDVQVSKGDKIKTKDVLGSVNTSDGKTEVHFEVWKATTKMNPALWIAKK